MKKLKKINLSIITLTVLILISGCSPTLTGRVIGFDNGVYEINVNEEIVVNNKLIILHNVEQNGNILIGVGNTTETFFEDETKEINGLQITNTDFIYNEEITERSATLTITSLTPGENDYFFKVFDSKDIENRVIILNNVDEFGNVLLAVDGFSETISQGETKHANGLQIKVLTSIYNEEITERSATLTITSLTSGNDEHFLYTCIPETINEKLVSIVNVDEVDEAEIDVEGVTESIREGETKIINGLEITLLNTFYDDEYEKRAAILKM